MLRFVYPATLGALFGLVVFSTSAMATTPQSLPSAPTCVGSEFRQLDFWLGDWDVRWDAWPSQPMGHGTNHVTRDFDDCVIHEHFSGGPSTGNLRGESWSLYHAPSQWWRQTWVDNQGGYFALTGGMSGDRFVLVSNSLGDNAPRQRMVFEDITTNSFTWRWQRTADGGATWSDSWVIYYSRRAHS
ncbi:MAG: hypothetical protein HY054_15790 [Proteobacteria bacterium]|nr:hypothetical protein [Pseudomonadota bacterium]